MKYFNRDKVTEIDLYAGHRQKEYTFWCNSKKMASLNGG